MLEIFTAIFLKGSGSVTGGCLMVVAIFLIIYMIFYFTTRKACPYCKSGIDKRATVCPKCTRQLP